MPIIRGRYYMNPAFGAAIESARSLADATQLGSGPRDSFTADDNDANSAAGQGTGATPGAIHRIEIDVAEAPAPGRGSRGYVAHIHRETIDARPAGADNIRTAFGVPSATPGIPAAGIHAAPGFVPRGVFSPAPESHVFSTAGDLVNFLRDTLAED